MHFKHEMIGNLAKISKKLQIKWNFELTVFELSVPDLYWHQRILQQQKSPVTSSRARPNDYSIKSNAGLALAPHMFNACASMHFRCKVDQFQICLSKCIFKPKCSNFSPIQRHLLANIKQISAK